MKQQTILVLAVSCLLLTACGDSKKERAATGAMIGAGVGAVGAAVVGANPIAGAAVGGATGAAVGALTTKKTINLGN